MTIYAKETETTKALNDRLRERKVHRGKETPSEFEKADSTDEKRYAHPQVYTLFLAYQKYQRERCSS